MYVCVCYVVLYVKTCLGRVGCPPASRFDLDYVWNGSFPVPWSSQWLPQDAAHEETKDAEKAEQAEAGCGRSGCFVFSTWLVKTEELGSHHVAPVLRRLENHLYAYIVGFSISQEPLWKHGFHKLRWVLFINFIWTWFTGKNCLCPFMRWPMEPGVSL